MNTKQIKTVQEIITDLELEMVWGNADFGNVSKREVVYGAVKKVAQGWANGSTSTAIIRELGLTEHRNNYDGLSDKGLEYLIAASQYQHPVPAKEKKDLGRFTTLYEVMKTIDEWLKSDDTFVTDGDGGEKIPNAWIDCVKGSLLKRMNKILPPSLDTEICTGCGSQFLAETMKQDSGENYFCKTCYDELQPLMQQEYEQSVTPYPVPDASQPAAVPDEAGEVYVWVKASERLPNRDGKYICKKKPVSNEDIYVNEVFFAGGVFKTGQEVIEWLSLHPSQPAGNDFIKTTK